MDSLNKWIIIMKIKGEIDKPILTRNPLWTWEKVIKNLMEPISYMDWLEDIPINVAHLPLWPTDDQIQWMIRAWLISVNNVIDERTALSRVNNDKWGDAISSLSINTQDTWNHKTNNLIRRVTLGIKRIFSSRSKSLMKEIANYEFKLDWDNFSEWVEPEIISYRIKNINELYRIMRWKSFIKDVLGILKDKGLPTIYLMNQSACQLYAQYLWWRLPSEMELIEIWQNLPWETSIQKAESNKENTNSWIPLLGHFNLAEGFQSIGEGTYLYSSWSIFSCIPSPKDPKNVKSLSIDSSNKLLISKNAKSFASTLVVFDKSI